MGVKIQSAVVVLNPAIPSLGGTVLGRQKCNYMHN